jgi:hypothetical protein
MYLPDDAVIHDNIIAALDAKIVSKLGSPVGWDDITYRINRFNSKFALRIG